MIPGNFPFMALSGDPGHSAFHINPLQCTIYTGQPQALLPSQIVQNAFVQETLRGLSTNLFSPIFGAPVSCGFGLLPSQTTSLSIDPVTGASVLLNPMVSAFMTNSTADSSKSADSHTIIRAPVLYKINDGSSNAGDTSKLEGKTPKGNEESPPDRIVASYAAAAHAAALVNHQPVSKAAETFLSVTSSGRSRHSKRTRSQPSAVTNRLIGSQPTALSSVLMTSGTTESSLVISPSKPNSLTPESESRRGGWSRIVDRKERMAEYISPEGTRLRNREEALNYLREKYPDLSDQTQYDRLVAYFVFEPLADIPISADQLNELPKLLLNVGTSIASSGANEAVDSVQNVDALGSGKPIGSVCRIAFNPNLSLGDDFCLTKRPRLSPSAGEASISKSVFAENCDTQSAENDVNSKTTSLVNSGQGSLFRSSSASDTGTPLTYENSISKDASNVLIPTDPSVIATRTQSPHPTITEPATSDALHLGGHSSVDSSYITAENTQSKVIDTVAKGDTETHTIDSVSSVASNDITNSSTVTSDINPAPNVVMSPTGAGHTLSLQANDNNLLAFNQLIATARLAQAQQYQQQVLASLASMPTDALGGQSAAVNHLVSTASPVNSLLLPGNVGVNMGSWLDAASLSTALSFQQQMATAAALQQQSALSMLLQRQQQALSLSQSQHVGSLTPLQAYLAAVQRQLYPPP